MTYRGAANASLAIIKYWGKMGKGKNIPASTSIGVTLEALHSEVEITVGSVSNCVACKEVKIPASLQQLYINGVQSDNKRFVELLRSIKKDYVSNFKHLAAFVKKGLHCKAKNTFPTAAGLASSASGGAALVLALAKILPKMPSKKKLSEWARVYSGSAARSIFGGFCIWEASKSYARQIALQDHWKDFRVIVVVVTQLKKKYSSRNAMNITKYTSPYYKAWIKYNNSFVTDLCMAIKQKDIEKLGTIALLSYMAMHASAMASHPSILFWTSESVMLLHLLREMRAKNIPAWETMDAGPQVKIFTVRPYVTQITKMIQTIIPSAHIIISKVGGDAY